MSQELSLREYVTFIETWDAVGAYIANKKFGKSTDNNYKFPMTRNPRCTNLFFKLIMIVKIMNFLTAIVDRFFVTCMLLSNTPLNNRATLNLEC